METLWNGCCGFLLMRKGEACGPPFKNSSWHTVLRTMSSLKLSLVWVFHLPWCTPFHRGDPLITQIWQFILKHVLSSLSFTDSAVSHQWNKRIKNEIRSWSQQSWRTWAPSMGCFTNKALWFVLSDCENANLAPCNGSVWKLEREWIIHAGFSEGVVLYTTTILLRSVENWPMSSFLSCNSAERPF